VEPPTALIANSKLVDTLDYALSFESRDTTLALSVKLVHVRGADTIPVPKYLVRYAYEFPVGYSNLDTTRIQLVDASKKGSLVDTTRLDGVSTRSLRITSVAPAATDSVILLVSAARPDATPVPGSPVRFVVHYTVK
jgi:hypothetical protein